VNAETCHDGRVRIGPMGDALERRNHPTAFFSAQDVLQHASMPWAVAITPFAFGMLVFALPAAQA